MCFQFHWVISFNTSNLCSLVLLYDVFKGQRIVGGVIQNPLYVMYVRVAFFSIKPFINVLNHRLIIKMGNKLKVSLHVALQQVWKFKPVTYFACCIPSINPPVYYYEVCTCLCLEFFALESSSVSVVSLPAHLSVIALFQVHE